MATRIMSPYCCICPPSCHPIDADMYGVVIAVHINDIVNQCKVHSMFLISQKQQSPPSIAYPGLLLQRSNNIM